MVEPASDRLAVRRATSTLRGMKTPSRSLKWALAVCALAASTVAQPRAQDARSAPLAQGDHHRWMAELFERDDALMDQSLARFIFPGTHDSGTFPLQRVAACEGCAGADRFFNMDTACREAITDPVFQDLVCDGAQGGMALVAQAWGEAQHLTVGGLLDAGARHFDLRFFRATSDDVRRMPTAVEGSFYIHHTLTGADSVSILDQIDRFIDHPQNASEIVILEFSTMMEGTGEMGAESIGVFFEQVRSRFGDKMAKRQTLACAANPDGCTPTQRFGDATTLREFLNQGSQVIVTCSGCAIAGDDIWNAITITTPSGVSGLNPSAGDGYPAPDNAYFPWRTEPEYLSMIQQLSEKRDNYSKDKMFGLGTQIGSDFDGVSLARGLLCQYDPENVTGYCPAINNDWDDFGGLQDVTNFINPMALAAIVGLRRDRVNIITFDHYDLPMTEEIFKLNLGATQVYHQIDRVENTDAMDIDSGPDYYPWFQYLGVAPLIGETRFLRYNQVQDAHDISPEWPAWKSYPNATETANVVFGIMDADPGIGLDDDDRSLINIPPPQAPFGMNPYVVASSVPVSACLQDSASCVKLVPQQSVTGGNGPNSSNVWFSRSACVWSWGTYDISRGLDPLSVCEEALPQLRLYDAVLGEGQSGSRPIEFVIALSAPSPNPVTVLFSAWDGNARDGIDYTAVTNMLVTIRPGDTRTSAKILVHGDTAIEGDEFFTVTLHQPAGATIEGGFASGVILDDDSAPVLSNPGSQSGDEGASINVALGTLSHPRGTGPWTIDVNWGDGATSSFRATTLGSLADRHTYADNGAYTVGVTATAADGVPSAPVSFTATIANVAPQVGALGLKDESGITIAAPFFALSDFPVDLDAAFTDAGTLDAHVASIEWGDGTSSAATVTESGGSGTLKARHTWRTEGTFTVTATVTDDDGGVGTRQTTVVVTDAAGTVCGLAPLITPMLSDTTLKKSTVTALTKLIGLIQGNNDGRAANGACDMLEKGNYVAAVVKIAGAVAIIEGLVAKDDLSPAQEAVLRQVKARLILAGRWAARAALEELTNLARRDD